MKRKKRQADAEYEKVKLDDRYGEIGISAVKAAVQCHGGRRQQQPRSDSRTNRRPPRPDQIARQKAKLRP